MLIKLSRVNEHKCNKILKTLTSCKKRLGKDALKVGRAQNVHAVDRGFTASLVECGQV